MSGDVLQGDLGENWQEGFSHSSNGLVCDICRSLVRKSPGDTAAHRNWHSKIEAMFEKLDGG